MTISAALRRVIEDDAAPEADRCKALRKLERPPLCMLRRLLVRSATRKVPVPSRLYALAALRYVKEVELRRKKKELQRWKPMPRSRPRPKINDQDREPDDGLPNALGI